VAPPQKVKVRTAKASGRSGEIRLDGTRAMYRDELSYFVRSNVVYVRAPAIGFPATTDDHVCLDVGVAVLRGGSCRVEQRDVIRILEAVYNVLLDVQRQLTSTLI
jgi:hypothetical protein